MWSSVIYSLLYAIRKNTNLCISALIITILYLLAKLISIITILFLFFVLATSGLEQIIKDSPIEPIESLIAKKLSK